MLQILNTTTMSENDDIERFQDYEEYFDAQIDEDERTRDSAYSF